MKVRAYQPWLYVAPMLLAVAAVFVYPLVQLFRYSVQSVSPSPFIPTTFVGLDNFRFIWEDSTFRTAIGNNAKLFLANALLRHFAEIASLAVGRAQLRSVLAELLWENPPP